MNKVVFVDRDGTIIREPRGKQVDSLEKLEFTPGIITGLKLLVDSGFKLVMVSNQNARDTSRYRRQSLALIQKKITKLLSGEGIRFEKTFICSHPPGDQCKCRKPRVELMRKYLKSMKVDRDRSFLLGDRETDVGVASDLGLKSIRLTKIKSSSATYVTADALDACQFVLRSMRSASMERKTTETEIAAWVSLDGSGAYDIATGIGFFDHMLAQLVRHSHIDLMLRASGDLHVDEHHTVEDVGIVLGAAIRKALGDKRGIERFAAPLDEALAHVALDLSGRSYLSFNCGFRRERVGDLPTELVEDFFRAFTAGLKATLHISCRGRNDHHNIEAIFKAVARALKLAVALDCRARTLLPSTKGTL
ncbi:MAG: imidazoleglycerol-phosphate dehydratase HisB [Ignavibacteria bacterium]|nr:imidazoleglycerol-phosphate dehydratase HisB [Ignavibacteria bacterium]MBI3765306.1 imidazoleglycerol-phosphate dehydratase HisB [Ignavibacteriales bacterium]